MIVVYLSKQTNNTPLECFRRVKIEFIKSLLESKKSIAAVMRNAGYSKGKAFTQVIRYLIRSHIVFATRNNLFE